LLFLIVVFFGYANIAEAHCKWSHPHHCIADTFNRTWDLIKDVVSTMVNTFVVIPVGIMAGEDFDWALCRWENRDDLFPDCGGGGGGGIVIPAVGGEACVSAAKVIFYNNSGPRTADEENKTVKIYRFTIGSSVGNASLIDWFMRLRTQVGNGLTSLYNTESIDEEYYGKWDYGQGQYAPGGAVDYYRFDKATESAPLLEVPYKDFCDANGVCRFLDKTAQTDSYSAYVAKTTATYNVISPENEVVYPIQIKCPSGSYDAQRGVCVISYDRWIDPTTYINYDNGTIGVGIERSGPRTFSYYLTDANGNKIYSQGTSFALKESLNLLVAYSLQGECSSGFTFDSTTGSCKSSSGYYGPTEPTALYINYNNGRILAKEEAKQGLDFELCQSKYQRYAESWCSSAFLYYGVEKIKIGDFAYRERTATGGFDKYLVTPNTNFILERTPEKRPVINKFLSAASGQGTVFPRLNLVYPIQYFNRGTAIFGPVKIGPPEACPAVPKPVVSIVNQSPIAVTLSINIGDAKFFEAVGGYLYDVYRDGAEIKAQISGTETVFTDSGLKPHTKYIYTVKSPSARVAPAETVQISDSAEGYTLAKPECVFWADKTEVVKFGTTNLNWNCKYTDPVLDSGSCSISGMGSISGATGLVKINLKEIGTAYTLSCSNMDGAVSIPISIKVLEPGIKEVRP